MHGPMSGVIKYFGQFQCAHQGTFLEIQAAGGPIGRYAVPSVAPSPSSFLQWFSDYTSQSLMAVEGRGIYPATTWHPGTRVMTTVHVSS